MRECAEDDSAKKCFASEYHIILDNDLERTSKPKCSNKLILRITFGSFKVLLLIFLAIFVVFPLVFKYCYSLQRSVIFLNSVGLPGDYNKPSKYGLNGSRNFYLTTDEGVKLGVWQILPENLIESANRTDDEYFENFLANGQNAIIYIHGNSGNRVSSHRVDLYKVLRKHFHVIAFDYRGYGDSDNVSPTEEGVVQDCMFMYKWVSNRTTSHVFIWGHSLGTAISMRSLSVLQDEGYRPTGIFLESPFNNMREEVSEFPLARWFKNLPWFTYTVIDPLMENGFTFKTDKYIGKVHAPIVILHAADDDVVPLKLGVKLYEVALSERTESQGKIEIHKFDGALKYGHKHICRAPDLHDIIEKFVARAISESSQKQLVQL